MNFDFNMNELTETLASMCGYLSSVQAEDGGFLCEACGFEHGRADNAIFPFAAMYSLTGDEIWPERIERLLDFREKLENDDGSVCNDFESGWKGISVFSAVYLYKTLFHFGGILPAGLRDRTEDRFRKTAEWVHENIKPGFRANINYYCASAAVNAMYGKRYGRNDYILRAGELADYCMELFTENGILRGEGQPHSFLTESGCVPADTGYIAEESIPALTDAAFILGDKEMQARLADYSAKLLEFMLPDGAWDNSFGSRNNKWTYYGSRTSSGCTGAFFALSKYRPELYEAAVRNLRLIKKCSLDGALYGGPDYHACNQKPCVHHTFSHACGIADAVAGKSAAEANVCGLPCDSTAGRCMFFKEINSYKLYCGKWIATFSGYDYGTYTRKNGAAHASGGTLSMLYHRDRGPVIAGSVSEYMRTETNNMQIPSGGAANRSTLPRVQFFSGGVLYSTALSFTCGISVKERKNGFTVRVKTRPENTGNGYVKDTDTVETEYVFLEDSVTITVRTDCAEKNTEFILPVVSSSGAAVRGVYEKKEKIFCLTPGFEADEYTFKADGISIEIK